MHRLSEKGQYPFQVEQFKEFNWEEILATADFLELVAVRQLAIRELDRVASSIQRIKLHRQYANLDPSHYPLIKRWFGIGIVNLCFRPTFLTEEEVQNDGLTKRDILGYAQVREKIACSPIPVRLSDDPWKMLHKWGGEQVIII